MEVEGKGDSKKGGSTVLWLVLLGRGGKDSDVSSLTQLSLFSVLSVYP